MITILPSAREDIADGFDFYERQTEGLGSYFMETLFSEINTLRVYAGIHATAFGYYRLLSRRFPYAVYYSIEAETVLVKAVLDCRRDPAWIRRRLKS